MIQQKINKWGFINISGPKNLNFRAAYFFDCPLIVKQEVSLNVQRSPLKTVDPFIE